MSTAAPSRHPGEGRNPVLAPPDPGLFAHPDSPDEADLYKCVHCGFCLQVCPTYLVTGLETESPRGRIALMKAVNEGRIEATPGVIRHWDLCIQCRACEVACPSGVPYGRLIEATMSRVETRRRPGLFARLLSNLSLRHILPKQRRLTLLFRLFRAYQRWGVQHIVRKSRLLSILPGNLSEMEASLPKVNPQFFKPSGVVVAARGETRARVALLSGCVMPLVHGPEMSAVVRVLARNGCEVARLPRPRSAAARSTPTLETWTRLAPWRGGTSMSSWPRASTP